MTARKLTPVVQKNPKEDASDFRIIAFVMQFIVVKEQKSARRAFKEFRIKTLVY